MFPILVGLYFPAAYIVKAKTCQSVKFVFKNKRFYLDLKSRQVPSSTVRALIEDIQQLGGVRIGINFLFKSPKDDLKKAENARLWEMAETYAGQDVCLSNLSSKSLAQTPTATDASNSSLHLVSFDLHNPHPLSVSPSLFHFCVFFPISSSCQIPSSSFSNPDRPVVLDSPFS